MKLYEVFVGFMYIAAILFALCLTWTEFYDGLTSPEFKLLLQHDSSVKGQASTIIDDGIRRHANSRTVRRTVLYNVEGRTYYGSAFVKRHNHGKRISAGDTVTMLYNSRNPSRSVARRDAYDTLVKTISAGVMVIWSGVMVIFMIFVIISPKKKE